MYDPRLDKNGMVVTEHAHGLAEGEKLCIYCNAIISKRSRLLRCNACDARTGHSTYEHSRLSPDELANREKHREHVCGDADNGCVAWLNGLEREQQKLLDAGKELDAGWTAAADGKVYWHRQTWHNDTLLRSMSLKAYPRKVGIFDVSRCNSAVNPIEVIPLLRVRAKFHPAFQLVRVWYAAGEIDGRRVAHTKLQAAGLEDVPSLPTIQKWLDRMIKDDADVREVRSKSIVVVAA